MWVVYSFSFTKFGISYNGKTNVNNAEMNAYILDEEIKAENFHGTNPEFTLFFLKNRR